MLYRPDWDEVRENFSAWWRRELDTPLVQVCSTRAGIAPGPWWDGWAFLKHRDNPERVVRDFDAFCGRTWFGGEAFPNLFVNLGPGVLAAYLSGYLHFDAAAATAWFEQPRSWEAVEALTFETDNPWWRYTRRVTELGCAAGRDRFLVSMTDIGGTADVLASLRGTEALLEDMLLEPGRVHAALDRIDAARGRVYDEVSATIAQTQHGTTAWMGLWCPERWYPLQCDFAAMIAPDMFREFVVPSIERQCRALDHAIYHWDGPGQIPHLDALLEIPELDGIQWVPGDGHPPCDAPEWFPLYERILNADKLLVLQVIGDPRNVPAMIRALPNTGRLLLSLWLPAEAEARQFLQSVRPREGFP